MWRTYIGERTTMFAKAYGIKVRFYGKHVEEHIGNQMGMHWELEVNIVGTHWERGKNERKILPTVPPHL
jgi:glutamine synthetase